MVSVGGIHACQLFVDYFNGLHYGQIRENIMKMLDMLMAYEDGTLDNELVPVLFQNLIDSGLIFSLQGHYVRVAKELVDASLIDLTTADIEE
jgi:hypothetical protein